MFNNKSLQSVAAAAAQIKTTVEQVAVNEKSVEGAVVSIMTQPTKIQEEVQVLKEGWDDMLADVKKRSGPQPSGGSGVKQGSRYGGGKQTSKPEQEETVEEKPKKKAKGKFSEMVNTYQETGLKALSEMSVAEETEQLDEISSEKATKYYNAAAQDNKDHADSRRSGDAEESRWAKDRMVKRSTGMAAAKQRMKKEETEVVEEELKGNQHKIDKNKNNKIDAHDFKLLRKEPVMSFKNHSSKKD